MSDFIFVFFTIAVITGLIYVVYKIMLGSGQKDTELQITSKELVAQLNILRKQKQYNIVESLAKNYLTKKTNDDGVRAILAKSLYESGKIFNAIEHAKVIVKNQPINFDMKLFLANCYLEVDKPLNAIEIYKEILENEKDNIVAVKELAQAYVRTNQKKSAVEMYKRLASLLDSDFERAKVKNIIAEIHLEFADYIPAMQEYEEILEIYPADIKIKKRLAEIYKLTSNYDRLIQMAEELSAREPDNENSLWALNILMESYKTKGDYSSALSYAEMIRLHPLADLNQLDGEIAKIFFNEGNFDSSIELLRALVEKQPDSVELKKELAHACAAKEDFLSAIDIYKTILEMVNVNAVKQVHYEISNLYSNWGMHLFSLNENEECFKRFVTAIEYCDDNADIYYRLGTINRAIKNFNESVSQYKKAIELDFQNAEYHYAISECYEEIDSVYEQKKSLHECIKYDSQNARAHYKLGLIYHAQNNESSAMQHIQEAVNNDEGFIEAKLKLALILEHIGKREEAALIYEDILRLEPENEEVIGNLRMLKG